MPSITCIASRNGVELWQHELYVNGKLANRSWTIKSRRVRPAHLQLMHPTLPTLAAAQQAFDEEVRLCGAPKLGSGSGTGSRG